MSSEVLKIGVLAVLLVSGIGYLSSMADAGSADPVGMLSPETDVSTFRLAEIGSRGTYAPELAWYNR